MKQKHELLAQPPKNVLEAMTFDEMNKTGHYAKYCLENYPDLYNAKYKEKFGWLLGQRPKEKMKTNPRKTLQK